MSSQQSQMQSQMNDHFAKGILALTKKINILEKRIEDLERNESRISKLESNLSQLTSIVKDLQMHQNSDYIIEEDRGKYSEAWAAGLGMARRKPITSTDISSQQKFVSSLYDTAGRAKNKERTNALSRMQESDDFSSFSIGTELDGDDIRFGRLGLI